jgi:hypothetical protein
MERRKLFCAQSEIQGPVSSSKYRSNRHTKIAAAAQMIGSAKSQIMISVQFDIRRIFLSVRRCRSWRPSRRLPDFRPGGFRTQHVNIFGSSLSFPEFPLPPSAEITVLTVNGCRVLKFVNLLA